jgi:YVTN family beta-propeller protein
MNIFNGTAYIVVNNGGKVVVANGTTFGSTGAISGLTYPRYFLGINSSTGYISEWGAGGAAGNIKVVNLSTKGIITSIPTGNGAEGMLLSGSKVYVACGGGFVNDSVISVINTTTNTVVNTINVGANPKSVKMDAAGKLWVLCAGQWDPTYTFLEKPGRLVRIDAATEAVDLSLPFSSTFSQPSSLVIDNTGTTLYYSYNGGVYSQSTSASSLSGSPVINRSFYGLGIDPTNNYIYASDAVDYSSNGKVLRYTPAAALVDSFAVGVIPGNFYFK